MNFPGKPWGFSCLQIAGLMASCLCRGALSSRHQSLQYQASGNSDRLEGQLPASSDLDPVSAGRALMQHIQAASG